MVAVLDRNGCPLMPCHPARARRLMAGGRAVVVKTAPFVIRLKDRVAESSEVSGVAVRIDPGSKGTGIAVTADVECSDRVSGEVTTSRRGLHATELQHRGAQIHKSMRQRADHRRRRRGANLRFRAPRFLNRSRPKGWLAPSLQHRVDTTLSTVARLTRWFPVTELHVERAAFDTAALGLDLESLGLPLSAWSGGRTKYNRSMQGLAKSHTLDALAVGEAGPSTRVVRYPGTVLVTSACGRGSYARTRSDKHGFPRLYLPRQKQHHGFATGDLVRAHIPRGKYRGTHTGRVAVRASGTHRISIPGGYADTSHSNLRLLQRGDGYAYTMRKEDARP
ncbi:RNA-guided endonuclease IscB [Streptomyces sp. NPDC057197]|uniref:RNA-guided endonuclease IscB n=1 Tax=Streptomyces sp. NPDC057197 TaxID=3346045 RepID=UPI00362AF294